MVSGLWWFIVAEVKVIVLRTVWEKAALKCSRLFSSWIFYANIFCFYAVVPLQKGMGVSSALPRYWISVFFPPVSHHLCPDGYAAYWQTVVLILPLVWKVLLLGCFLYVSVLPLWRLPCAGPHVKLSGQWLNYFRILYPLINYQLNKTAQNFVSAV